MKMYTPKGKFEYLVEVVSFHTTNFLRTFRLGYFLIGTVPNQDNGYVIMDVRAYELY